MPTLTALPSAPPEEKLEAAPHSTKKTEHATRRPSHRDPRRSEQIANTILLAILFAAPALMAVHAACANDFDIFWHLRTGEWILQHHAVPQTDPFSSALHGKPWQAYSWLFELIVIKLFYRLGLTGIVAYTSAMVLAVTVAIYSMVKRLQADITLAVLITFATGFAIGRLYMPRPWMFTILFFVLELSILMRARRTGRTRELVWLPLIFALWANIHIEYIDGLLVLGLAVAESFAARWWSAAETRIRPVAMVTAFAASILATLVNPYGWRVYSVVFDYGSRLATAGSALNSVSELQSIPFRNAADFAILLLALLSSAALAWQRRFVLFETALLGFAAVVSFRSQRDIWLIAIVSAAILASRISLNREPQSPLPARALLASVVAAGLLLFAGFRAMHVDNAILQTEVSKSLPAKAVQAIHAGGYAGPVFDDYNWGGYLIWSLRMPVSMDGRASFYGDEKITRSIKTWNGEPDWASDPALQAAGVVIAPVKAALTQLLRTDAHYQLVYQDDIAAVFVPRR